MFKSKIRASAKQTGGSDLNAISLGFKLMFVYHIVMMVLFIFRPIENPNHQLYLAISLVIIFVLMLVGHKKIKNWFWPGLSFSSIPSVLFNLVFIYIFFAFFSYSMRVTANYPKISLENIQPLFIESWEVMLQAASVPALTLWFLAGLGILIMNSLVSLKLASLKKEGFEAQCGKHSKK